MSIAFAQRSFDTDPDAITGFADLLRGGFENPEGKAGLVRVTVPECPDQGFLARCAADLQIERHDMGRAADTVVTIPIATIRRILSEFETLDWRDPGIIGTMVFEGDLGLAAHLAKSCVRPSDTALARFRRAERLHAARGYRALTAVDRLHRPTQRQILEAMEDGRPVVVTGLEHTPPCRDWTTDRLVERFGDAVVRVRSATQRQTMADFVREMADFAANPHDRLIEGFVKPYTEGAALPEAMQADFGPLFFDRGDFIPPQLWLGCVPTHVPTSGLHRDPLTGFLLQVMGRKRLDLYSADQAALLYPMKAWNLYQPCWFRPEAPDEDRYPLARGAACLSVTLNPGELIIQPAGWFHQVHALDSPNMSVSYFWRY